MLSVIVIIATDSRKCRILRIPLPWLQASILVLPSPCPYQDVPKCPSRGPIPLATLTEMARLVDIVIVVVAELRVEAVATGTRNQFVRFTQGLIFASLLLLLLRMLLLCFNLHNNSLLYVVCWSLI